MLLEIPISANDAGQRAERFLRRYLPQLSTGRLQSLFRRKEIKVSKKPIEQAYALQAGDVLRVFGLQEDEAQRPDREAPPPAYPMPNILYEDFELLVVDKPSGVAAHPGSGILPGASLIERVRAYLAPAAAPKIETQKKPFSESETAPEARNPWAKGRSGKDRKAEIETPLEDLLFGSSREGLTPGWGNELFQPSLAHRLDKETSGALLVAKTGGKLRELTEGLREGRIRKRYLALVAGHPKPASGTIRAALERDDNPSGAKSRVLDDADEGEGKASVTHYKTLKTLGDYALLQVNLETGRMHQIRAHLAHIGHPIVGDTRYDKPASAREHLKKLGLKRLFLHAEELSWTEGSNKRTFTAPLPAELRKAVEK
jgi:23S rRNA-/tRNA-specific pseudouridylate synthase